MFRVVFAALVFTINAYAVDVIWTGLDGNWNDLTNWSTLDVPDTPDSDVFVDGGAGTDVSATVDVTASINSLTISSGDVVALANNRSLTLGQSNPGVALQNDGAFRLESIGNTTRLTFTGNATVAGSGELVMGNNNANAVRVDEVLTNGPGHTIRGAGNFLENRGGLINQGTVEASSNEALTIDPDAAGFLNQGFLRATGTGGLNLQAGTFTNTGRTIEVADESIVRLFSGNIVVGGEFETLGSGVVSLSGNPLFQQNVRLNGSLDINNNRTLTVEDGLINDGRIRLLSIGNRTRLFFQGGDQTLGGAGEVIFSGNQANSLRADGLTLTLGAGQTLRGSGGLLGNRGGMINQGAIIAEGSVPLHIDPNGLGFDNQGTLRATGGGGLQLAAGNFVNDGQTIEIGDGSNLRLVSGTRIIGGTLEATGAGTGFVNLAGNPVLENVTLNAPLPIPNNRTLTVENGFVNNTNLTLNSIGNTTQLMFNFTDPVLTGAGDVTLSDNSANQIRADGQTLVLDEDHAIRGAGNLMANRGGLINRGSIVATGSIPLVIDPDSLGFANEGQLRAEGTGGLDLQAASYANDGNTIEIGDDSKVRVTTGTVIVGGVIEAEGNGTLEIVGTPTFDGITLEAPLAVSNNRTVNLNGGIVNQNTISLESIGNTTILNILGQAPAITGEGAVVMSNNGGNQIRADDEILTVGPGQTIRGAGNLLANRGGMILEGTLIAEGSQALTIDPNSSNFENSGDIRAAGTGGLSLAAGLFINTGREIEIADGSRVTLTTGTEIAGGTLRATGDGTGIVALAGTPALTNLTLEAPLAVSNNRELRVSGQLTNNNMLSLQSIGNTTRLSFLGSTPELLGSGEIVMSGNAQNQIRADNGVLTVGESMTIRGAGNLLANRGGMVNQGTILANESQAIIIDPNSSGFVNDGMVLATGNGGVVFEAGDVTNRAGGVFGGVSTIDVSRANFTNAGAIAPGVSAGRLTMAGDVPFTETASLDIEIGGATPGAGYDVLSITGSGQMTLAGNLNLSLINNFLPPTDQSFVVLETTGSITGSFANVIGGTVIFPEGQFDVTVETDRVTLSNFVAAADPTKRVATVTLTDLDQIFDGAPRPVTVTTDPPGLNVVVTYDGEATPPSAVGSYEVLAEIVDDEFLGRLTGRLNIVATQTLDFPALTPGPTIPLSATASSGLPVVFSVTPSRLASIQGGDTLIARRGGEVVVTAAQDGDGEFLPVTESQTLRLPPLITAFRTNGANVDDGRLFQSATARLELVVLDDIGIDEVVFSLRRQGQSDFTEFASDNSATGGFTATLPVLDQGDGVYEIRATATATDGVSASITRTVEFIVRPNLTLVVDELAYLEGDDITGTVSLESARNSDTVISFAVSRRDLIAAPQPVTIPAGSLSVPFVLDLLQDELIEPDEVIRIEARTATTGSDPVSVDVIDDDLPALELALDDASVSEAGGENATFGTVSRTPVSTRPLTIQLSSSDPSAASVPATVTIPANEANARFEIDAVDDVSFDGAQTTVISGALFIQGQGVVASTNAVELRVTDDEEPRLELAGPASGFIPEGGTGFLTVRRITVDVSASAEVSLAESGGVFDVPASVTIPADETEVTVAIGAVAEDGDQGERTGSITATADGLAAASLELAVTDRGLADLRVTGGAIPASVKTDAFFSFSFDLANSGLGPTDFPFAIRAFLSRNAVFDAGDTQVKEIFQAGRINVGEFTRSETIRAPRETGEFYLILVVDPRNAQEELFENNNLFVFPDTITVEPAYKATVSTETVTAPATLPVVFTGSATSDGAPVPSSLVNIHITSGGVTRIISGLTDAVGEFTVNWFPLPGESGDFQIGAAHPGEPSAPVQDQFTLINIEAANFPENFVRVEEGTTGAIGGSILNPNDIPLTGVEVMLEGLPPEITAELGDGFPASIPAGGSLELNIPVTVADDFTGRFEAALVAQSAEGVIISVPVFIEAFAREAVLVFDRSRVEAAVLRGGQRVVPLTVTNEGGAASGPLTVTLPPLPWLSLSTPARIANLDPGESSEIELLLRPDASVQLTEFNGTMAAGGMTTRPATIPFTFRVVTNERGDLAVDVIDEFFYFSEERPRPKVAEAQVTVADAISGEEIARAETDETGEVVFTDLRAGFYTLRVNGPRHAAEVLNVFVEPGEVTSRQVFITRQSVTYNFTVREIAIEDRYRIAIETTFETNVPKPVVTVEPPVLEVDDLAALGQSKVVNFTITNHGLIAAEAGGIDFPDHPFFEITPLVEDFGTISAKGSVTIPVTVRRIGEFDDNGDPRFLADLTGDTFAARKAGDVRAASSVPCSLGGTVRYRYICGPIEIDKTIRIPGSGLSCPGGGGGGGGPTGGLGIGGGGGSGGGGSASGGGGRGRRTFSAPDVVLNFSAPATANECPCFPVDELCLGGSGELNLSSLADSLASAVSGVLPPWASVEEVSITVNGEGELCLCCDAEGNIGVSGNGNVTASVEGTIIIGYSGDFELEGGGDILSGSVSLSALAGVRTTLSGSLSVTGMKECGEEFNACVTGTVQADLFAGLQGEGGATLTLLSESGVEQTVSGSAQGEIGVAGFAKATAMGCLDGTVTFEACASAQVRANASVTFETPAGEETKSINGDGPKLEIGDCAEEESRIAIARLVKKSASGRYQLLADDIIIPEPFIMEVPGSDFVVPEQDIVEDVFNDDLDFGSGVCAQVRLRINQDLVTTRSAFLAALELENNDELPLTNVEAAIEVRDAAGNDASEHFNIRVTRTTGVDLSDGPGTVASGSAGSVEWTLIPRDSAAPDADTVYTIGGLLRYNQEGNLVSVPVETVEVTVMPDAALHLSYFHQRDVYSDDPFTEIVEPSIPYSLAVVVENRGAGTARDLTITSAQPQIVENDKGLLIDFQIIATEVAGQNLLPSLNADFGDIEPGETKIATWLITSTLQGLFLDYDATFEHLTGLGDPRLSLIRELEIFEMIRPIQALGALDDGLPDFLTNDEADPNDYPDTIHLSGGEVLPVALVETATHDDVTSENLTIQLNAELGAGWSYLRIPDPGNGVFRLVGVTRSDGRVLPPDNFWVTDRTFRGLGRPPRRENILHLADDDSTGAYTLEYVLDEVDDTAPVSMVAALPANVAETFIVNWSSDDPEARYDVFVSENGGAFTQWQDGVAQESALFMGEAGVTYGFYSVGIDTAGNREQKSAVAETAATVIDGSNQPPVFTSSSSFAIGEGETLNTFVRATDPDGPVSAIRYSLVSTDNPNLILNEASGAFSFVSNEADGGEQVTVTVMATDSGLPPQQAMQAITIDIAEANNPPEVDPPAPQTVEAGETLVVELNAEDVDQPAQAVTFSLLDGPGGMTVDADTGVLSWTPSAEDAGQTFVAAIEVTDDGQPPAASTIEVTISVEGEPVPLLVVSGPGGEPLNRGDSVEVGGRGDTATLTIANEGGAALNISRIALQGGLINSFTLDASATDFSLTPGQETDFAVTLDSGNGFIFANLLIDSDVEDFNLSIEGEINEPPHFAGFRASTPFETPVDLAIEKVLARASDPEGQVVTLDAVDALSTEGGTVQVIGGVIRYTPAGGFSGDDDFGIMLADSLEAVAGGVIVVNVRPPRDAGGQGANPPRIRALPGGAIEITVFGVPGTTYDLQRSQILNGGWQDAGSVEIGPDGVGVFTDQTPPLGSVFYRLNL